MDIEVSSDRVPGIHDLHASVSFEKVTGEWFPVHDSVSTRFAVI